MSDDQYSCGNPTYREPVDPQAPDTVPAHRWEPMTNDFSSAVTQYIPVQGVYFHGLCYPGDSKGLRRD